MPVRAVLDSNVLVSGLVAEQGPPRQVLDAWLEGRFTLVTSLYLVEELTHVLSYPRIAERLRLDEEEVEAILSRIGRLSLQEPETCSLFWAGCPFCAHLRRR